MLVLVAGGTATALVLNGQSSSDDAGGATETPVAVEPVVFPEDEPAAAAGASPCTTVNVISSFENAEMVSRLAEGYNAQPRDVDGTCVTVVASKDKSGLVAEDAARNFKDLPEEQRPTVWVPDASSWIGLSRSTGGGATVPAETASIGASDIVLAMPEALAAAIGWQEEAPTWAEVYEAADDENAWSDLGHPEWGAFKLGKTSPLVASSGEAALLSSYASAAGTGGDLTRDDILDPDVTEEVRQHELATSHYMATPEHFLWHARQSEDKGSVADFLSAVIVDEKSVWDYNRGITSRDGVNRIASDPPVEKLVPIYPTDGFYVADNPAVVLNGAWIDELETAAGQDFLRFAVTKQGQKIVRETGYRDLNGEFDPLVAEVGKFAADPAGALPFPRGSVIRATQTAFPDVRKRAEVLFLVDVSGSMEEPIAGGKTKLAAAKDAISEALGHFTPGDNVGLAAFSADDDGVITPGLVSPVADIGDESRQLPERARSPEAHRVHAAVLGRRHVRQAAFRRLAGRPHQRDRAAERRQERDAVAHDHRRPDARQPQGAPRPQPGARLHAGVRCQCRRRDAAVDLERDRRPLLRRDRPDEGQRRARRPRHELLSRARPASQLVFTTMFPHDENAPRSSRGALSLWSAHLPVST